ncbi:hypothetical protein KNE206_30520 [Kitasatospora sp. NE20-6]
MVPSVRTRAAETVLPMSAWSSIRPAWAEAGMGCPDMEWERWSDLGGASAQQEVGSSVIPVPRAVPGVLSGTGPGEMVMVSSRRG